MALFWKMLWVMSALNGHGELENAMELAASLAVQVCPWGFQSYPPEAGLTLPSPHYLRHPPQYFPPSASYPLPKEMEALEEAAKLCAETPSPVPTAKQRYIEKQLQQQVGNFNYKNLPLREALEHLQICTKVLIIPDEPALRASWVDMNCPISLSVENISYLSALRQILEKVDLTYRIEDRGIKVTTRELHHGPTRKIWEEKEYFSIPAPTPTEEQKKTESRLQKPVSCEIKNIPLRKALADLATDASVTIVLDEEALRDAHINGDAPVSLCVENVRLINILFNLLSQVELSFRVDAKVICVTTPEKAHEPPVRVKYFIEDFLKHITLVETSKGIQDKIPVSERLVNVITATIAPNSWKEVGGWGTVDYLEKEKVLIVDNVREVQEEVRAFLKEMGQIPEPKNEPTKTTSVPAPKCFINLYRSGNFVHDGSRLVYSDWNFPEVPFQSKSANAFRELIQSGLILNQGTGVPTSPVPPGNTPPCRRLPDEP